MRFPSIQHGENAPHAGFEYKVKGGARQLLQLSTLSPDWGWSQIPYSLCLPLPLHTCPPFTLRLAPALAPLHGAHENTIPLLGQLAAAQLQPQVVAVQPGGGCASMCSVPQQGMEPQLCLTLGEIGCGGRQWGCRHRSGGGQAAQG